MKKALRLPKPVTETITLNPAQAQAARRRARQLGLSLEEFIVYAAIRYMDDRTPMLEFSGSKES